VNRADRARPLDRVHASLGGVAGLLGAQILLLSLALELWQASAQTPLWPAVLVSGLCCLGCCRLAFR